MKHALDGGRTARGHTIDFDRAAVSTYQRRLQTTLPAYLNRLVESVHLPQSMQHGSWRPVTTMTTSLEKCFIGVVMLS